jgi:hypothetical protein
MRRALSVIRWWVRLWAWRLCSWSSWRRQGSPGLSRAAVRRRDVTALAVAYLAAYGLVRGWRLVRGWLR